MGPLEVEVIRATRRCRMPTPPPLLHATAPRRHQIAGQVGLVWFGSVWFGSVWVGSGWVRSGWFGLGWVGPGHGVGAGVLVSGGGIRQSTMRWKVEQGSGGSQARHEAGGRGVKCNH